MSIRAAFPAVLLTAFLAPAAVHADNAYVPGEVLVQFHAGAGPLQRDAALARVGGQVREHVQTAAMTESAQPGFYVVSTAMAVDDAVARLRGQAGVDVAEPNYLATPVETSNDTYYTNHSLWGMYSDDQPVPIGPSGTTNAYGSQAEKAWASGKIGSSNVYVGVVDEGIQYTHPDLAANVWTNPFDPVDGVDNDGNGYVDDIHGWDFYYNDSSIYDGTVDNHGTHVSGTIGGVGGNGQGVAGVCWHVTLISAKFLGPENGPISAAIKAIDYVSDLKTRHGLKVVATNHSWITTGYSRLLNEAVIRSAKKDILVVCAAGNSSKDNDTNGMWPCNFDTTKPTSGESAASYDAVIAVAAIDSSGALASFSDWGKVNVDLGAPGVGVISTVPTSAYSSYSGTSMATPHVTGSTALLAAANPGLTAAEIKQEILDTTIPTTSLQDKTVTGGRLNLGGEFVPTHDVAVTSISAPSPVTKGASVNVSVSVRNDGTQSESFTVSVTDTPPAGGTPGTLSAPKNVVLAAGATSNLTFTWNTTNASYGLHLLEAAASVVPGETDTADNTLSTASQVNLPKPTVKSITPKTMTAGTTISVTVTGTKFVAPATLTFTKGSGSPPTATNVVVAADGKTLTADVSAPPSTQQTVWDVVVTNPDGQSASKGKAFTVKP